MLSLHLPALLLPPLPLLLPPPPLPTPPSSSARGGPEMVSLAAAGGAVRLDMNPGHPASPGLTGTPGTAPRRYTLAPHPGDTP